MSEPTDRELANARLLAQHIIAGYSTINTQAALSLAKAFQALDLAASRLDRSVPREPTRDMCHAAALIAEVREYKRLVEKDGAEVLGVSEPVPAPIHDLMLCYKVWTAMWDASPTRADNRKE